MILPTTEPEKFCTPRTIDAANVALTGVKRSEEGNELIVRMVEINGKESVVTIKVPVAVSSARRLNLIEWPLAEAAKPTVSGKSIQLKVRPYEIVTLGCKVR